MDNILFGPLCPLRSNKGASWKQRLCPALPMNTHKFDVNSLMVEPQRYIPAVALNGYICIPICLPAGGLVLGFMGAQRTRNPREPPELTR